MDVLHDAGVDLAAYAENEIRLIKRILMRVFLKFNITCRLLYGPEPDDWGIEIGAPGEAYAEYFWRGIEAAPIGEELAVKVLDLVHRVKHPGVEQCDIPGSWQCERDEPIWNVKGWLAYMMDRDMAQMEMDLEVLDDEEFYEEWNLDSVMKEWPCIERKDWSHR